MGRRSFYSAKRKLDDAAAVAGAGGHRVGVRAVSKRQQEHAARVNAKLRQILGEAAPSDPPRTLPADGDDRSVEAAAE